MLRKMGEAVARVARKVNETVESGSDTLDLAECKLVSFPIGIYKVLRNVTDQIHLITLANNELKSLTSKFMTTFCQLRDVPVEKLAAMPALHRINLRFNPLNAEAFGRTHTSKLPASRQYLLGRWMSIAVHFPGPCGFEALFLVLRASSCPESDRRQPPSIYCFLRTDLDEALHCSPSSALWAPGLARTGTRRHGKATERVWPSAEAWLRKFV
ncbi:leucine-rich repeat-containing protein 20 isoform X2 [Muntiacus reevesi]|uniref:leucine-rich repeat-containing protein 20 isoform X2 n=1 Tax=Muntiacus reevesi TaxID=9886 RepID=UPI0033077179